jgi:hypothetical protein
MSDKITSRPSSQAYRDSWDRIWGKGEDEPDPFEKYQGNPPPEYLLALWREGWAFEGFVKTGEITQDASNEGGK